MNMIFLKSCGKNTSIATSQSLTLQRYGIFPSLSDKPGDSMIAATMVPSSKKIPYMIRADVEFLHPGPLLQQQLTAVEVKQHAMEAAQPPKLKIAPILGR